MSAGAVEQQRHEQTDGERSMMFEAEDESHQQQREQPGLVQQSRQQLSVGRTLSPTDPKPHTTTAQQPPTTNSSNHYNNHYNNDPW
jgi:hypothetical protein